MQSYEKKREIQKESLFFNTNQRDRYLESLTSERNQGEANAFPVEIFGLFKKLYLSLYSEIILMQLC